MWQLWRQDDNGQKFLVETFSLEQEAQAQLEVLESRGHKQTYWITGPICR